MSDSEADELPEPGTACRATSRPSRFAAPGAGWRRSSSWWSAASIVRSIVTNKNFQWGTVWHYLGDPRILHGVVVTLYLTALSMVIGVVLGILLAVMRLSPNPIVNRARAGCTSSSSAARRCSSRSSSGSTSRALFQPGGLIGLGVPFGPDLVHLNANSVITPFGRRRCSRSGSTRAPTWPRSSAPGSSPSTRASRRRRRRSAWAACRSCATSCCRRRCG